MPVSIPRAVTRAAVLALALAAAAPSAPRTTSLRRRRCSGSRWARTARSPTTGRSPPTSRRSTPPRRASSVQVLGQDDARRGHAHGRRSRPRRTSRTCPRLQEIARRIADPRGLSDGRGGRAGATRARRSCSSPATSTRPRSAPRRWRWSGRTRWPPPRTRRRSAGSTRSCCCSCRRSTPTARSWRREWYRKNLGTPLRGRPACRGSTTTTSATTTTATGSCSRRRRRGPSRARVYHEWFPQVWLDEHQMGATGPRIFVPPYAEPGRPRHPPARLARGEPDRRATWRCASSRRARAASSTATQYDAYWPGGTKNTAWWKNISGLLTEVASARLATPVRIEPGELAGGARAWSSTAPQTNFPNPWPGGWWRLRDIMDYERIASDAILETCADRRADFLRNALARARAAVAAVRRRATPTASRPTSATAPTAAQARRARWPSTASR